MGLPQKLTIGANNVSEGNLDRRLSSGSSEVGLEMGVDTGSSKPGCDLGMAVKELGKLEALFFHCFIHFFLFSLITPKAEDVCQYSWVFELDQGVGHFRVKGEK